MPLMVHVTDYSIEMFSNMIVLLKNFGLFLRLTCYLFLTVLQNFAYYDGIMPDTFRHLKLCQHNQPGHTV